MSPFDLVKSFTQTKDNLYTTENIFDKEYNPFMVNRILSNSPGTVLFANAMNQYGILDKKLQYDFYRIGIPKTKNYTKWIKKESHDIKQEYIEFIAESLNISINRALETYKTLGEEVIVEELAKRGGKK